MKISRLEKILIHKPNATNNEIRKLLGYEISGSRIRKMREKLGISQKDCFIFVYGSLLSGLHNHYLLNGIATFVREDFINAQLFTSNWAWPFIKLSQDGKVRGEIYHIKEKNIYILDHLEGYHIEDDESLFLRKTIKANSGITAFVYEGGNYLRNSICGEYLPSGDWQKELNARHSRR